MLGLFKNVLLHPKIHLVWMQGSSITHELRHSAHSSAVHDVVFPHGCSDLIASCSYEEVRVWDVRSRKELLRIRLPGLDCLCLAITQARQCPRIVYTMIPSIMRHDGPVHVALYAH